MNLEKLYTMLKETGYPVAYSHFQEENPPTLPFITYLDTSENFGADNRVYHEITDVSIELYTETKDIEAENKLQDLLNSNDLFWNKTINYIPSEKVFQVTYEITLI